MGGCGDRRSGRETASPGPPGPSSRNLRRLQAIPAGAIFSLELYLSRGSYVSACTIGRRRRGLRFRPRTSRIDEMWCENDRVIDRASKHDADVMQLHGQCGGMRTLTRGHEKGRQGRGLCTLTCCCVSRTMLSSRSRFASSACFRRAISALSCDLSSCDASALRRASTAARSFHASCSARASATCAEVCSCSSCRFRRRSPSCN